MYASKNDALNSLNRGPPATGSRTHTIPKFKPPRMNHPRHAEAAPPSREPVASSSNQPSYDKNYPDYSNQHSRYGTSQPQSASREPYISARVDSWNSSMPSGMKESSSRLEFRDDTSRIASSNSAWEPQRLEADQSLGSTFEFEGSAREKANQKMKDSGREGFKREIGQQEIDEREAKNRLVNQERLRQRRNIELKKKAEKAEAQAKRATGLTVVRPADTLVDRFQQEKEERKLERQRRLERETQNLADSDSESFRNPPAVYRKISHHAREPKPKRQDTPEITSPSSAGSPGEVQVLAKVTRPKARRLQKPTSPSRALDKKRKKEEKNEEMPDASPQKSMEVLMAEMRAEQEAERKAAGGMTVDDEGEMSDDSIMAKYRDDTDDEILRPDDEAIDPNTLCPFCSRSLPSSPSSRLARLKTYLLDRPHIYPQATARNPQAMYLPAIETANFCRMHDREVVVIPEGLKRGWPQTHDWTGLPKRIDRGHFEHLHGVIQGSISSPFLKRAKRDVEEQKGVRGILSDMATFQVEQPGYYGVQGLTVMLATLRKLFITDAPLLDSFRCAPLSVDSYLRKVLVPELALELIREDLGPGTTREAAETVLHESRSFGNAMFGGEDDTEFEPLTKEEEEKEEKEARDEKENFERGKVERHIKIKGKGKEIGKEGQRNKKSSQPSINSMLSKTPLKLTDNVPSSGSGLRKPKRKLQMEQKRLGLPTSSASTSTAKSDPDLEPSPDAKNKIGDGWFGKTTQPLPILSSAEEIEPEETEVEIAKPSKKRKSIKPIVIEDSESD